MAAAEPTMTSSLEAEAQLKRSRDPISSKSLAQGLSRSLPATWNGLSQMDRSGKFKDVAAKEDSKNEAARLTRRKLADGSAQEDENICEAMDNVMEMEMEGHDVETPPRWPEKVKRESTAVSRRSPCASPSLSSNGDRSTSEMSDVDAVAALQKSLTAREDGPEDKASVASSTTSTEPEPPLAPKAASTDKQAAKSKADAAAHEAMKAFDAKNMLAGMPIMVSAPMLVKSDGQSIPLDPALIQQAVANSGWTGPSSFPKDQSAGLPITPTLAMSGISLSSPSPLKNQPQAPAKSGAAAKGTSKASDDKDGDPVSTADLQAIAALTELGCSNGDKSSAAGIHLMPLLPGSLPTAGSLPMMISPGRLGLTGVAGVQHSSSFDETQSPRTPSGNNSGVNSRHGAARGRQVTRSCPGCSERISIACKVCSLCGYKFRGANAKEGSSSAPTTPANTPLGGGKEDPLTPRGEVAIKAEEVDAQVCSKTAGKKSGTGEDENDGNTTPSSRQTVTRVTPNSLELHKIKEQERRAREKHLLARLQTLLFREREKAPSANEATYNYVLECAVNALQERERRKKGMACQFALEDLGDADVDTVTAEGGARADMEKHKIKEQQRRARKRQLLSALQTLVLGDVQSATFKSSGITGNYILELVVDELEKERIEVSGEAADAKA